MQAARAQYDKATAALQSGQFDACRDLLSSLKVWQPETKKKKAKEKGRKKKKEKKMMLKRQEEGRKVVA